MGLDMYLYLATKPEFNDQEVYEIEELRADGYSCFSKDDYSSEYYEELFPFSQMLKVKDRDIDFDKIAKEYLLDNDVNWRYRYGEWYAIDSKSSNVLSLSVDVINEKYVSTTIKEYYVTKLDEVHYWRKAYDEQDFFYERLDVENTKYCAVSDKLIERYNEIFEDQIEIPFYDDEKSGLFYWEWY